MGSLLLTAGAILSFSLLFFSFIIFIYNLFAKTKKVKKEEKFSHVKEDEKEWDQKADEEIEPGLERLSDKAIMKYIIFKRAFPIVKYKMYKLIKLGIMLAAFFIFTFGVNIIFGIAAFFLGMMLPDAVALKIANKKIEKFELQLVDGITIIANAMKSGTSFSQAVEVMMNEMKPPLSTQFGIFLKETRMGASIEEALDNLYRRVKSEELNITVVSINIARQSGGNLSEILLHIADTIRERERIKGKIVGLTSQGKLSGIVVGSLPIGLAFILNKIDPIMMEPLFNTFMGQLVFLVVFIMEFIGFLWIMKIIAIDI